jgi:hypothetical protein
MVYITSKHQTQGCPFGSSHSANAAYQLMAHYLRMYTMINIILWIIEFQYSNINSFKM